MALNIPKLNAALAIAFTFTCVQWPLKANASDRQEQPEKVQAELIHIAEKPLNELFSTQWVRLDAANSLSGNLVTIAENEKVALAGLPVYLVQKGEVAFRTHADEQGSFVFSNVLPGSYSIVSRTNESIAAFSLQVLDASNTHLPTSLEVRVVRPAGEQVKEILRSNVLPSYPGINEETPEITSDPLGDSRSFSKSYTIKTDRNGSLVGQLGFVAVAGDLSDMNVYVLNNGMEIARAPVSRDGKFQVAGLIPGVYGFVAAGSSGFAATSFHLVNAESATIGSDGTRLISIHGDACGQMNVEVVPCCEIVCCEPVVEVVEILQEPIVEVCGEIVADECGVAPSCGCGGGWGGGGGFGGGGGGGIGGGGLGGIGAIAGIAGLAAGIAALADDNNDAPLQSPVVP